MELNFIDKSIKICGLFAAVCFLAATAYWGTSEGIGIAAGAAWGCVNLLFIKYLLLNFITIESRNVVKIILLLGVKFPVLYLLGYALLLSGLPLWALLFGSSLIFCMLFFNGILVSLQSKVALCLLALLSTATLSASLEADVPELPNALGLLEGALHGSYWMGFLEYWESIIFSIAIALFLSLIFHLGARKSALIPSGLQNFLEWAVENLRNLILEILGPDGEKFVPFLGTLFIYILTMNWLVLIPLMKAPSSDFNITIGLAICVFVLVQYLNIKNFGFRGFLFHMAGSPKGVLGWALVPLMFFIELLTQFTRPLTLGLRLFGNVVGEDILIGAFALFGVYLLASFNAPIGVPMQIPFMFLALLTGLIQAVVFTLLSTIYILLSTPHPEEHS